MKQINAGFQEQVTCVSWKYKKCKTTLFLLIKTVLNKDEEYPTAHYKTRSDPARLKDSSYTAPSEGTEASEHQISTKYSTQLQREMESLGNSAHEPLVSKPFVKAAQVNKEQWELLPHINTSALPLNKVLFCVTFLNSE